jgi:hypothetical protein
MSRCRGDREGEGLIAERITEDEGSLPDRNGSEGPIE